MALYQVNEGEYTKTVYGLIKEQKFADVIGILSNELEKHPKSRPALSLLGYSYYQVQDFINAAECYAELTKLHPEVEEYKLYHAQALYKSFAFAEAMKASYLVENPDMQAKTTKLQAAIKYSEEDLPATKSLVEQIPDEDPDKEVNSACILYKEGQYEEACEKFTSALNVIGLEQDLWYNVALCNYKLCHYSDAIPCITAIYEKGIKDHPELSVGMITEFGSMEVRSVGNTKILEGTYLIEAFNLRAAIEYTLKKISSAMEALTDMPPRGEQELDPVTLHNQALIYMEQKPTEGFEKLQFLLQQNPFPPETFGNLLLLYCKYQYYDLAADVLAENSHLTYKFLNTYMFSYLDAVITQQTSVEEAFRKFDDLTVQYTENLRKLTKKIQETRQNHDEAGIKKAVKEYDDALERYVPVLMSQAKIYWDRENYPAVEKVFRKSVEFCQDNETWKLNVGHVLFMQENKYKEAIGFYEPVVKKYYDNILEVSAIVLANLCVSYIMTSANEEAEELMRKIEKEEEQVAYDEPDKKIYHLCIVNLVIGTLYCSKGNYEFGISRIIKSLEPYNKKLGTDTWYYAKRCFLSLIENMAKQMIMVRDSIIEEVLAFFDQCEIHGRDVLTVVEQPLEQEPLHAGKNTVTYEARILKHLFLTLS